MVFFTIYNKKNKINYPYIVLNGQNFYKRARELMHGRNQYKRFPTANERLEDLSIKVLGIDLPQEEINKTVAKFFSENKTAFSFTPTYDKTIAEKYVSLDLEQNFDFYQNICDYISERKITQLVYLVIFKNVSKHWVSVYLNIDIDTVSFLLENLPVYYNYLKF